MRKILVTAALPYANGSLHLGHLLEQIQTDIWVRWQKMMGNNCIFVCGEDAHGTPIMLSAKQQNISPEELIAKIKIEHERDLADFFIGFDNYYTTHSPENQEIVAIIYAKLQANGDIEKREISQLYDETAKMFLPDRFVKGTCPRCGAKDQYGDNCESCGATYATTDLIDAISTVSGSKPVLKNSEHYFFRLEKYTKMLQEWLQSGALPAEIAHKLNEWFIAGLKQWDISRDAPYFGLEIPNAPGKYFYVWLDAPIGYIASFKNLCARRKDLSIAEYWDAGSKTELYHFVGKDIVYFHSLFWPAILDGSGHRKPTKIFVHGYLTVNGEKMSKSRGTFVLARDYLNENLNPECLRYYFAAKLNNGINDIDLNFQDFALRVNSDLIGKVINIASRCANFINKYFAGKLSDKIAEEDLFAVFKNEKVNIANFYEKLEYSHAMRLIMALADRANQYIDEKKPWSLAKHLETQSETEKQTTLRQIHEICSMGINLFRILMIYLKPVLPITAEKSEKFLNVAPMQWHDCELPLLNHQINVFEPLMNRVDLKTTKFNQ